MSIENHRTFDPVPLVAANLNDSLVASPPDLYVLAGAVGRARRLSAESTVRLQALVAQAEVVLSDNAWDALCAFEAVDGEEFLDVLTNRLEDDDGSTDTLLSVLFDLDEWACAAETLGVQGQPKDMVKDSAMEALAMVKYVMADACAVVEDFATAASVIAPVATRLMTALQVTEGAPAHALWTAVARASAGGWSDADVPLAVLPDWLTSRLDVADAGGGGVVTRGSSPARSHNAVKRRVW